ncbi:integrase, catalytic region, zinc finger, CCHC-type containing protein [Tanacetum coccineum]|uniref:Integrase, catalytic region, zinc finger, CCHC-type containing protein n=1 Tax=Tanacetum coccineum TaxID=301880 RepID=A0ABQ5GVU8_9ASTR
MTTLAKHIIVAGAENCPPMLEKSMYDSWASRICLFIKGKKHGRMLLDSVDNGPLVYPTIVENGQTRPKKYSELTEAQQLQDDYDVQATNIILHGLPPDVRERYPDSLAFVANSPTLYNTSQSPQHSGEDPIECINKAMTFLSADGRVTVQQVQGRQNQSYASTRNRGITTSLKGNVAADPPRVVKCYNCQREGHMARQCTQPKRPRNAALFKEKLICDPEVLSEVPYSDSYPNDMINQDVLLKFGFNASTSRKGFCYYTLENELRKLREKFCRTVVSKPNATIAPRMFKRDIEPISHRHKNNRDAHEVYIEKTIENTDTLLDL